MDALIFWQKRSPDFSFNNSCSVICAAHYGVESGVCIFGKWVRVPYVFFVLVRPHLEDHAMGLCEFLLGSVRCRVSNKVHKLGYLACSSCNGTLSRTIRGVSASEWGCRMVLQWYSPSVVSFDRFERWIFRITSTVSKFLYCVLPWGNRVREPNNYSPRCSAFVTRTQLIYLAGLNSVQLNWMSHSSMYKKYHSPCFGIDSMARSRTALIISLNAAICTSVSGSSFLLFKSLCKSYSYCAFVLSSGINLLQKVMNLRKTSAVSASLQFWLAQWLGRG